MAYTAQQILEMASKPGGGQALYEQYQQGAVSIQDVDAALAGTGKTASEWLASNVGTTTQPNTGQSTPVTTGQTNNQVWDANTIYETAKQTGGGKILYNQYKSGNLTMDQIDAALAPNMGEIAAAGNPLTAKDWINQNVDAGGNVYTTPVINRSTSGINPPLPNTSPADESLRNDIARGNVSIPGADLQAIPTPLEGTLTPQGSVQQIQPPTTVQASVAGAAPIVQTQTADAATAANMAAIGTSTMEAAEAGTTQPTTAAQGTVSDQAIAGVTFTPSAESQAEAATVVAPDGAMVEAVVGTMPPEAIAEAAEIAGLETARIERAKNQLRKAGLSDQDIADFGNDPNALELRLTDFSEEQRGIIGGLPEEALVSTQMEQLLAGIENGEVPLWAKPAVASVEAMLARRGMSASTVAREELVNAIITASLPVAQLNAQSIKESVLQQRGFEQQAAVMQAQLNQQATLQNAQNVFALNIRNLDAEQQAALANSQFMQTVALTETNNRQQTAIQNAVNMMNLDVAQLDSNTRLAVENAKSFLQMDLTNLNNAQQALLIDTQYEQQRLLSNASAQNAAKQFNAASENQTNQFMASLAANINQFNAQQVNAIETFNATEANKISAQNAGNQIAVEQFNAQIRTQVDQFNSQQEAAIEQWNAANAQAIEQSNIQWRRQANTADTAAQNAINQQNVQNAFALTQQAQAALWQELRDKATFTWQSYENKEDREAQLYAVAIGNEAAAAHNYDHTTHLVNLAKSFFGGA